MSWRANWGSKLVLRYTKPSSLVRELEEMVAAGTMKWDLISVDNDTLGILVQKGLVQNLSHYKPYEALIPATPCSTPSKRSSAWTGATTSSPFAPMSNSCIITRTCCKEGWA